jgi:uncharacterized protein YcbX
MYLSQIFIYPIKSARGAAVTETALDIGGPVRDRRWMLVDEQGVFLSQRIAERRYRELIAHEFGGPKPPPAPLPLCILTTVVSSP